MRRALIYVAAPLRPTEEEIAAMVRSDGWVLTDASAAAKALKQNLDRALRWLAWLRKSFPETTFIAPWIASVQAGADDADPAQREAGMLDACAVLERCDGIVLCGGRISSGMRREMEHGLAQHFGPFLVYDITRTLLALPHPEAPAAPRGRIFRVWYDQIIRGLE